MKFLLGTVYHFFSSAQVFCAVDVIGIQQNLYDCHVLGVSKNVDRFENAVTPSFMKESFPNFVLLKQLILLGKNDVLLSGGTAYRK